MYEIKIGQLISTPESINIIEELLPKERLRTLASRNQSAGLSSGELYVANIRISAQFWMLFHLLEVLLRNSISDRLLEMFPRDEWWGNPELFHRQEAEHIRAANVKTLNRKGLVSKGDVIAGLNFGFWTILISGSYHQKMWVGGLSKVFRGYSGKRKNLYQDLDRLRKLRNRIAHHEPIMNRDLHLDLNLMIQILHFLGLDLRSLRLEKFTEF